MTITILPADDSAQGGAGTATDPLRIHGPQHFDRLLTTHQADELRFLPGVYWTRGPWAMPGYCVPNPCRWTGPIGSIIRLSPDAVFETNGVSRPDTLVMRCGQGFRNNVTAKHWYISGLEFDGNEAAFPADRYIIGCLSVWGSEPRTIAVTTRGQRGHRPTPENSQHYESFGITFNNHENGDTGTEGGGLIENCTCYDDGDRNPYFSGIYPGFQRWARALMPTVVRNCSVIGLGKKPSGIAFSLQGRTHFYDCTALNTNFGFYNDVGVVEDCVVENCRGDQIAYCAVALRCSLKGETRAPHKKNVRVLRSKFNFVPTSEWLGLWIDDSENTGATIDNIELDEVEFNISPAYSGRKFNAAVLNAKKLGRVTVDGRFPAGWISKLTQGTPAAGVTLNGRI